MQEDDSITYIEEHGKRIHKLLHNGLAVMGKHIHFTEEEMERFSRWVASRL